MKQTIISKCFGKMKRVALTLFAALCVGSVWGEESNPQTRTVEIDGGYKIFGLGENHNETAVVFTKIGSSTWTVPTTVENVQFLVVGGGGGGGGDLGNDPQQGGGGGGGGGVVTGLVTRLEAGDKVDVIVGAGGAAGVKNNSWTIGQRAGGNGGQSLFTVNDVVYITAFGGGGDGGFKNAGKEGGSSGGSRPDKTSANATRGSTGDLADGVLYGVEKFGERGGSGLSYAGGGGGGATDPGDNAYIVDNCGVGGEGGQGLTSDITGNALVYGSGGGGGSVQPEIDRVKGGEGAGDGGTRKADLLTGTNGLANRGGGGGGGGRGERGGAGGSGIVVLRYVSTHIDNFIPPDELESPINTSINNNTFVFNGQNQSPLSDDLLNSDKYSITGDVTARDAGTYTFSITPNEGYAWDDETRTPKEFTWTIHSVNPAYGYVKDLGDEVIVVFTNHTASTTWMVPYDLNNVEFLVVGGGGGGAGARKKYPGAGGGGGGVATGFVTRLETGSVINVKVGKGGSAGKGSSNTNNDKGRAGDAEDTYFSVGDVEYVRAGKGGSGQGYDRVPGKGASNSGNCSQAGTDEVEKLGFIGSVGEGVPVREFNCFGHAGGYSYNGGDSKKGSGGGGGAGAAAPNASSSGAGAGGTGFYSSITGENLDYGSGGGGGANGIDVGVKGGDGAGNGSSSNTAAGSALANRGGGGGGGGTTGDSGYGSGGAGGSGIVVFRYSTYEAKVTSAEGSTAYATFAEAFSKANTGDEVTLIKDVTTVGFVIDKAVTLNLNGKTLTLTPPAVGSAGTHTLGIQILPAAQNVTIKDGTICVAEENLTAEKPIKMMINNYTNLALVNATLDGTNLVKPSNMAAYTLSNNSGTVTIDADSEIIAKEGGIAFDVCKYSTYEAPTVTVAEGATITGTVELSGGTLDAPEGITVGSGLTDWVAKYVDGAWTLVESVKNPFVVDGTRYATFADALTNVADGGTITVHENAEKLAYETPGFVLNKSVMIELNGRTLTLTPPAVGSSGTQTLGIQILPAAQNVTIKNGTINVAEANLNAEKPIKMMINNYVSGTLTLENVNLDGTNLVQPASSPIYVLSNNQGTVNLIGTTSITVPNREGVVNPVAFDVCKYASYAAPTVTLNTTGTIAGKVEVSGGDFVIGNENTATLSAIDFTAGSVTNVEKSALNIPSDKMLKDENGKWVLTDLPSVAQVEGLKGYSSLQSALDAATQLEEATITLLEDVEEAIAIPENFNGTIDLGGKTLTGYVVSQNATVLLKNGSIVTASGVAVNIAGGNVELNNLKVTAHNNVVWANGATVKITGDSGEYKSIAEAVTSANVEYSIIRTENAAKVTVEAGKFYGEQINKKVGSKTYNGMVYVFNATTADTILISGGTFEGLFTALAKAGTCEITGGKFRLSYHPTKYIPANLMPDPTITEGYWTIVQRATDVARFGDDVKPTLLEAIAAAQNTENAEVVLLANTSENITIPEGFKGTINLGAKSLIGYMSGKNVDIKVNNGRVIHDSKHDGGSVPAIEINGGSLELKDINLESNQHGVRLKGSAEGTINSGTYRLMSGGGDYALVYLYSGATGSITIKNGCFYGPVSETSNIPSLLRNRGTGSISVKNGLFERNAGYVVYCSEGNIEFGGGRFEGLKYHNSNKGTGFVFYKGGSYSVELIVDDFVKFADGYKAVKNEETQYWDVVAWTAPMPTPDGNIETTAKYDKAVSDALANVEAQSITVTVNGEQKFGNAAVEALNTAFACFADKDGNPLVFANAAATLDIEIKVTEVNTTEPWKSKVEVTRDGVPITVKATPTVKYFYPDTTEKWQDTAPTSGAVLFKLVFEAK